MPDQIHRMRRQQAHPPQHVVQIVVQRDERAEKAGRRIGRKSERAVLLETVEDKMVIRHEVPAQAK
jgi:hypothetical protein